MQMTEAAASSPEEILARAAPRFFPSVCEWVGCRGPAELLNFDAEGAAGRSGGRGKTR